MTQRYVILLRNITLLFVFILLTSTDFNEPPLIHFKTGSVKINDPAGVLDSIGKYFGNYDSVIYNRKRVFIECSYCEQDYKKNRLMNEKRIHKVIYYLTSKYNVPKESFIVYPYAVTSISDNCPYVYFNVWVGRR
ncbi:MAG: hypothetical protein U0U66_08785 [Cytophagaceae bacterium]